jgi:hypothetical protein
VAQLPILGIDRPQLQLETVTTFSSPCFESAEISQNTKKFEHRKCVTHHYIAGKGALQSLFLSVSPVLSKQTHHPPLE